MIHQWIWFGTGIYNFKLTKYISFVYSMDVYTVARSNQQWAAWIIVCRAFQLVALLPGLSAIIIDFNTFFGAFSSLGWECENEKRRNMDQWKTLLWSSQSALFCGAWLSKTFMPISEMWFMVLIAFLRSGYYDFSGRKGCAGTRWPSANGWRHLF